MKRHDGAWGVRRWDFLVVTAGILWGCMGLYVRSLNTYGLTSMDIVALRAAVTCAGMFLFLVLFRRELLKIHWRDFWCFLGTGLVSIVFFNFCYFKTIALSSLAVAAVLLYTAPAIVMALSVFLFGEKITGRKLLSMAMTFLGCVLVTGVTGSAASLNAAGILTGLGAGLGYALYSIFSRYALNKGYHTFTITFYTFLVAAVGTCFLTDVRNAAVIAFADGKRICLVLGLGMMCTIVPYLIYTIGLEHIENSRASILASAEPVAASVLGVVVFREKLSLMSAAGIVIVLLALVFSGEKSRKCPGT